jgi:hypothetical protein
VLDSATGTALPSWIWDDAQVACRVRARLDDAPYVDLWWDVAACARLVGRLTSSPPPTPERWMLPAEALDAAFDIARRLPPPLPAPDAGPPWRDTISDIRRHGPGTAALERIGAALCADLDEPWSCPHRLSGLMDDLADALLVYLEEYARLIPLPRPRSAGRWRCRRPLRPASPPAMPPAPAP